MTRRDKILAVLLGVIASISIVANAILARGLVDTKAEIDQAHEQIERLQQEKTEASYRFQACLSIARKQNSFVSETLGALGSAAPPLPDNALIACSIVRVPEGLAAAGGPPQ